MLEIIEKVVNSLYADECYNKEYSKIYKIHKYWARKPWYIVEKYIKEYSSVGELVFDPFCGSGSTGSEATINGRNFLGQDLNPTAIQVAQGTIDNSVDISKLQDDFLSIQRAVEDKIMSLYSTDDVCTKCGNKNYFKYICNGPKFQPQILGCIYCPVCNAKSYKRPLTKTEQQAMEDSNNITINTWIPDDSFPKKFFKDRFSYKGIHKVTDMYTRRNLYSLSLLLNEIRNCSDNSKQLLMLAFSNTVLHVSKLKGENVRPLGVNNYWIPDDYIEENVWFRFKDRFLNVLNSKEAQNKRIKDIGLNIYGNWEIHQKSALSFMGNEIADYIFTDPPYGEAIQYSELSFVWNAWFNEIYNNEEEIIVNPVQHKDDKQFSSLLNSSLDNIYAALKHNKYFTLCFQNKNFKLWRDIVIHCKELGFKLVDISIYDTYGSPFNKSWAKFSPKADIYVTFRKTDDEISQKYSSKETVEDIVSEIIQYMKQNNIPMNNNRLYDYTVAYLIWALYFNTNEIIIQDFDIPRFTKMVEKVLEEKKERALEGKKEYVQLSLFSEDGSLNASIGS